MPAATVELTASKEIVVEPLIWRVAKLFNVVTNIQRARVSHDYAVVSLGIEGSKPELDQAVEYLKSMGITHGGSRDPQVDSLRPEESIPRPYEIDVRLTTVTPDQGKTPILYRVGKDFSVVVNVERGSFDEDGGSIDVLLSGPLSEVQRAIAYLHTTGIHVNPRQRSVTDFGNL